MRYAFNKEKHIHTLDGKPLTGTSSVVNVLAKVLTWWASAQAVSMLGWSDPKIKKNGKQVGTVPEKDRLKIANTILAKIKTSTPQQYLALLDEAYKAHSVKLKDTAEAGTDLHAELERFVKYKMYDDSMSGGLMPEFDKRIYPFINWAEYSVKRYLWSEVHCYHEGMWVGGISDVGVELNAHLLKGDDGVDIEIPDGTLAIIDFKSAKEVYASQFIQTAGYALQIEENGMLDEEGNLIARLEKPIEALVIVPFGKDVVYPEIRVKAQEYKEGFKNALALYRLLGMDRSEYPKK